MTASKSKQHQIVRGWHEQYHGQLVRFLRRGGNAPSDVQDLSQEVFLRLLRVEEPELVISPKAYLYRVAVHVLDEWRTRQQRDRLHSSEALEDLSSSLWPFDDDEHRRAVVADMRQALADLPPSHAAALVLRWHHGMSYAEIANRLDATERMVKRYIVKGYAELRIRFTPQTDKSHD